MFSAIKITILQLETRLEEQRNTTLVWRDVHYKLTINTNTSLVVSCRAKTGQTEQQMFKTHFSCFQWLQYLNCSKECTFFGFHSTSEIQFFWRWNISPSSLLAERKMSTKRQDTPLYYLFSKLNMFDSGPSTSREMKPRLASWKLVCCYMTWYVKEILFSLGKLAFFSEVWAYLDRD